MEADRRGHVLVLVANAVERDATVVRLRAEGYEVAVPADADSAARQLRAEHHDAAILDLREPGARAVLEAAARAGPGATLVALVAEPRGATDALRAGADHVLPGPVDADAIALVASRPSRAAAQPREGGPVRGSPWNGGRLSHFVAESPAMRHAVELARATARSSAPVLLSGEQGVGKRALAHAVHAASARAAASFESVTCDLDPALLEAELFGEDVRAVTGASERRGGALELGRGGTVFLDEVGALPASIQESLARALAADATAPRGPGTVRVIASTTRDLRLEAEAGRFRADLLALLAGTAIAVPPLRERRDDIPLLVLRFLEAMAVELGRPVPAVSAATMSALIAHPWPGNVSELRRAVERGALAARGPALELDDLGLAPAGTAMAGSVPLSLHELERRHIAEVLAHTGGNVSQSARLLEIDRVTLYNKMRRYGIRKGQGR